MAKGEGVANPGLEHDDSIRGIATHIAYRVEVLVSLRRIERELRAALQRAGREDLIEQALDGVRFTDDGGTIYIHVFAKPDWPGVREGDALVLANADYPDLQTLAQWREFLEEGRLYMRDELQRVVRWLQGGG